MLNDRCWARAVANREFAAALADATRWCSDSRARRWHGPRGFVLLRLGRYDEAIGEYDTALRLNPTANRLQAASLFGKAIAEQRKGDVADGSTDLDLAQAIAPDIAQTFASYGIKP